MYYKITHIYAISHTFTNSANFTHLHTNAPNSHECMQIRLNPLKYYKFKQIRNKIQCHRNSYKLTQFYTNSSKFTQIHSEPPMFFGPLVGHMAH